MLLSKVKKAVAQLSPDELRELREFIQQHEQQMIPQAKPLDMDALHAALAELREGLTDEEFALIERDMNSDLFR